MKTWITPFLTLFVCVSFTASWAGNGDSGEPLPPDGGAPFAAYLEYVQAVHSADWETFKRLSSPENMDYALMEGGGSEDAAKAAFPEFAEGLAMFTPRPEKFLSGHADEQRTRMCIAVTIEVTGMKQNRVIEMATPDGAWRLESEAVDTSSECED